MADDSVDPQPRPDVMPVDRKAWRQQLDISNFVNCYYQYRDISQLAGVKRILLIGPGQGLEERILRWRGYLVTTFDIDETFEPDVLGSVDDLSMFGSQSFDLVLASHVIEHVPPAFLDKALSELSRVARYAVIYIPITGRPAQIRIRPSFFGIDWAITVDFFNGFRKPDPNKPLFAAKQHYWEVGRLGYRHRDIRRRFGVFFDILRSYRNLDWPSSLNFVLRSKTQ